MTDERAYCAIDPGSDKFGLALGTPDELLFAAIIPESEMNAAVDCILSGAPGRAARWRTEGSSTISSPRAPAILLGNGTCHEIYEKALSESAIHYELIDESMTTLAARALYWELHPPKFLARVIPTSWRVPPRPLDDLAAWAIIKRAAAR
jgi:hypothetical protein